MPRGEASVDKDNDDDEEEDIDSVGGDDYDDEDSDEVVALAIPRYAPSVRSGRGAGRGSKAVGKKGKPAKVENKRKGGKGGKPRKTKHRCLQAHMKMSMTACRARTSLVVSATHLGVTFR